jgi:hypothetical protein
MKAMRVGKGSGWAVDVDGEPARIGAVPGSVWGRSVSGRDMVAYFALIACRDGFGVNGYADCSVVLSRALCPKKVELKVPEVDGEPFHPPGQAKHSAGSGGYGASLSRREIPDIS